MNLSDRLADWLSRQPEVVDVHRRDGGTYELGIAGEPGEAGAATPVLLTIDPPLPAVSGQATRRRTQRWTLDVLVADLTARLDRGEFPAGSRFPSQSELVRHYQVSAAHMSRAVAKLRRGVRLEERPGVGLFVVEQAAS